MLQHLSRSFPVAAVALLANAADAGGVTLRVAPDEFTKIQEAIDAAQSGDTVLVSPGVYRGVGNRDLDLGTKELVIKSENGAAVTHIVCDGTPEVPFRGFLIEGGQTAATVIEGFTISGGATLPGAVADPFNGGAIRMLDTSPIIRDCVFENNAAGCWGGAVYSGHGGTPLIENCVFRNNFSADGGGGFFSWNGSSATIRNSVFIGNDGTTTGGAICHFSGGTLTIENSTFTQNTGNWPTAVYAWSANISNTIVWGNFGSNPDQIWGGQNSVTASHSNFEGGLPYAEWDAGGNIAAAPRFQPDGFHLSLLSPCINAGDPATVTAGQTDIDGRARVLNGRIDMGADEFVIRSKTAR